MLRKIESNPTSIWRVKEIAQTGEISVPLAENLVGQAARADLIFDLAVFGRSRSPFPSTSSRNTPALRPWSNSLSRTGLRSETLLEVVAVEQVGVDKSAALFRERRASLGELAFADRRGHDRRGLERAKYMLVSQELGPNSSISRV